MPALTATFTDRALAVVEKYGFSVIPCQPRGKAPLRGAKSRTNTPNGVRAFASQIPEDANFGICADDRFTILETDNLGGLRTAMGRPLPRTFCVSARKNRGYFIFRQTPKTLAITKNYEWEGVFEWRHRNEYVIGPGSIHPDTLQEYQVVEDVPPIPFPDWLVDKLIELYRASPSIQKPGAPTEVDKDAYGRLREAYRENCSSEDMLRLDLEISMGRHGTMLSIAGLLHDGIRTEEEGIEILRRLWDKFCTREPRGHEIEGIAEHAWKRDPCEIEPLNLPSPFSEGLKIFGTEAEFKAYLGEKAFQATKPPETGGFVPQSIVDFMAKNYPPPEPLIEGVLYVGDFTSLIGRRRNGKTTLLHNMALAGASGDASYLGLNITRPFKTLAFYFEDDPGDMQEKLRKMLSGREANDKFHLYTKSDFRRWEIPMNLSDAIFRERILTCCDAHRPDWVTFDNLGILIGADYNNAKTIHELIKFVWDLQSRFRCAVTVAAHPRKQSNDIVETLSLVKNPNRFFEECMGSSHFINSTGGMWGIERDESDRTNLALGSQRVTGEYTITVAEKDENHWLNLVQDANISMGALLNSPKRKQAWFDFPNDFTFESGLESLKGNMSRAAFARWWGELKRSRLIVPLEEGSKMFRRSDKAVIKVE